MKPLTAHKLRDFLNSIENTGIDLNELIINYRYDEDSDVEIITSAEEDLFDEETNGILTSIILKTKK